MHVLRLLSVLMLCCVLGCGGDESVSPPSVAKAAEQTPQVPSGNPEDLPKVAADADKIAAMLRKRFGEPVARNIRIGIEDRGGIRVRLTGEVPTEEIRQAVMREVEARVEGLKYQDFNLEVAGPIRLLSTFDAKVSASTFAVFSPDLGLTVTQEGLIYETATGRRLNRIPEQQRLAIKCIAIAPDGRTMATGHERGLIQLWELPLARTPRTLQPMGGPTEFNHVLAIEFTRDGKQLVSITEDRGEIQMWDLSRGTSKLIGSHLPTTASNRSYSNFLLAVAPDGKTIATSAMEEDGILLWDVAARAKKTELGPDTLAPEVLAWSHDGRFIAAGRVFRDRQGAVVIWDIASGQPRYFDVERSANLYGIALSPDDKTMAVFYSDQGLRLWDVPSGKLWMELEHTKAGTQGRYSALAFSPDGAVLASECDSLTPPAIRLWEVSRRPGAQPAVAQLPAAYDKVAPQDDRLASELEAKIRGTFDRRNIESLKVEVLPDGSVKLTGKVSSKDVRDIAGRESISYSTVGDDGVYQKRKVINELEVTGRYGR